MHPFVVIMVGADPLDRYDSDLVRNLSFQPVLVPTHIEDHNVISEKACGLIPVLNVLVRSPLRCHRVCYPPRNPSPAIGMTLGKLM